MKHPIIVEYIILMVLMMILSMSTTYVIKTSFTEYQSLVPIIGYISTFFTFFGVFSISILNKKVGNAKVYSQTFLGLKVIKLFISLLGYIVYVFFHRDMLFPFTIIFVTFFVVYTVFETIVLTKQNKIFSK